MASAGATKSGAQGTQHELVGVVLTTLALLLSLSLLSYSPRDPLLFEYPLYGEPPSNLIGKVGMTLAAGLFKFIGAAAYVLPFALGVLGARCFLSRSLAMTVRSAAGFTGLVLFLAAALALRLRGVPTVTSGWTQPGQAGGYAGRLLSDLLLAYFATVGTHIIIGAGLVLSMLIAAPVSLVSVGRGMAEVLGTLREWPAEWWSRIRAPSREKPKAKTKSVKIIRATSLAPVDETSAGAPAPAEATSPSAEPRRSRRKKTTDVPEEFPEEFPEPEGVGGAGFVLPAAEALLSDPANPVERLRDEEIRAQAGILITALANFGINGQVVQTHVGPVVTMYEFEPAPGVKVARIVNLADDLALALKAMSLRIVAPIPGKAVVGIEIPNPRREDVALKEIILSEAFAKVRSPLKLALGKDIFGAPVVADLRGMPHLLVAGATGSGKSVGLNTMILSILFGARPDEVKFLMIDPKMLELGDYEGIPHLWRPVITQPKAAARGLLLAVREMDRRYKLMAEHGTRNIETYNRTVTTAQGTLPFRLEDAAPEPDPEASPAPDVRSEEPRPVGRNPKTPPAPLPYLVIVIDELADLMMLAAREVEDSIARLAQMARAAGIHLILATQRPSVDVLTGIIKANFPARLAFQVASKTDSRTILDQNGAEQLLGRGDMLYLATGSGKLTRVHGAFVPDADLKKVLEFIKAQSAPAYPEEPALINAEGNEEESDRDEIYEKAKEIVISSGQASASFLQRRLRIGYPRAARLIEMMEQDQIVGPPSRDGRRDVLIKRVGVDDSL